MPTLLKPIHSRRKVDAAQDALRNLARSLGAHAKLPTVREICKAMRISAVTAEAVLSGLEEQGVLTRRQGSGIFVSPRLYQKSVGLVFGRQAFAPGASPFCGLLIDAARRRAESHNEVFSFYMDLPLAQSSNASPVHADLAAALEKGTLDGILLSARHSEEQETWLRSRDVPVVSFAGGVVPPIMPKNVYFDLKDLASKAARELVARGCRRIGMISAQKSGNQTFPAALASAGAECVAERYVFPLAESSISETPRSMLGARSMQELLGADASIDGVIVTDDMLATGAITACRGLGLTVGRDILIASHANRASPTLEAYAEQLVLVEVDPEEIVHAMFAMLESMMNGVASHSADSVGVGLRVRTGESVRA